MPGVAVVPDKDYETPDAVCLGDTVREAFGQFRFGLGEVVRHKTLPRLKWVVHARVMTESPAGVDRSYFVTNVSPDMEDSGPVNEHQTKFYEYELIAGDTWHED
jgi:hypothetical protein